MTAAGKRELPAGMRSRFTELWVAEPSARADLEALVAAYLLGTAPHPPISGVVDFYLAAKAAAVSLLRAKVMLQFISLCLLLTCSTCMVGKREWQQIGDCAQPLDGVPSRLHMQLVSVDSWCNQHDIMLPKPSLRLTT